MIVSLIGFSGSGKSHLASRFATQYSWERITCDDRIEALLEAELPPKHEHGILRVAEWLGQPYTPGFSARQKLYLAAEDSVMREICGLLEYNPAERNILVDTTGSVIYVQAETLSRLKALSRVVYLQIPSSDTEKMFEQYFNDPKPLIWQDHYQPGANETPRDALHRCYANLLAHRARKYEELSDACISASFENRSSLSSEKLFQLIEAV